jgi:hypothetical protein
MDHLGQQLQTDSEEKAQTHASVSVAASDKNPP